MMNTTGNTLTPADRETFRAIAAELLPAWGRLPGAESIDISGLWLDRALAARPDLREDVIRGLRLVPGSAGREAAERLLASDGAAFDAIGLAATGAYFLADEIREKLGYPGQESVPYDPHATPEYEANGMLERVRARGPIWRRPPDMPGA
ncbi:hypothetical protein [Pseudogemmobacter humi]|nr:hypothetical protein [Pseudogemmobacter humi]